MTAVAPPPAAGLTDDLLWSDEEIEWAAEHAPELLSRYLAALRADLLDLQDPSRQPIPNSPGSLAAELTKGKELHPPHLQAIDEAYLSILRGDVDRLLITVPPQHGKSSRARWASLHRLLKAPEHRIVVASAELDLAREHTRWVRNQLEDEGNAARLGLSVARDRRSARAWDLAGHRGGMYAVGVGGALTGRPADLLQLDDPVKDPKAVEKPEQRKALWDWWTTVAMTRLSPEGAAVVIMTRWHEDDIAGRILKSADSARWHHVDLPAIAEDTDQLGRQPGEALWPGRYDRAWLDDKKVELGSRNFASLYQGRPVPAGGTLLKRHWFRVRDDWPRYGQLLRYWDLAATDDDGSDPDWSCGALLALSEGQWWVIDIERFRESPGGIKRRLLSALRRDGRQVPVRMEQEPGSSGKILIHDLATTVYVGADFRAKPSTGSKSLRANPLAAAAEAGNVNVLDRPWLNAFLDEAESFPFGTHDDQVDAVAGAMNWLAGPLDQTKHLVQQGRWAAARR